MAIAPQFPHIFNKEFVHDNQTLPLDLRRLFVASHNYRVSGRKWAETNRMPEDFTRLNSIYSKCIDEVTNWPMHTCGSRMLWETQGPLPYFYCGPCTMHYREMPDGLHRVAQTCWMCGGWKKDCDRCKGTGRDPEKMVAQ